MPRGSRLIAALWILLGLAWAAAVLLAAATVGTSDGGVSMAALIPAALLGPAAFGAAAWVELRRGPRSPGARVELSVPGPGRPGIIAIVRRRRRARASIRVALVARSESGDLAHVDWIHLPADRRAAVLRFWAPPGLCSAPGDRWQVMVIEDEPWGSRHRALDLGSPVLDVTAEVGSSR